ncbi:hypothetical protein V494_05478 [Pseudogymnoascus sp. VKM F-4513 (FW-928)]|nr:hypothetical protein V494_05478 [Pseudogymnoascus sp. VKM F-4513 (FW-928)]
MGQIPPIEIPASSNIVTVRVIDTTTRLHMPVGSMFDPVIKGHTTLASPSYSFLIENERLERKVLYDLGTQQKWQEQAPCVVDILELMGGMSESKKMSQTFLKNMDHWHWDHLGDPSTFPTSTDVIVGPGFLEEFLPGGKPIEDSPIKEEYYKDRNLREISEAHFNLKFGEFAAFDYFGDGSFLLINSPGHAIGHMCALARTTTNPDTFIFMGGDIASHAGEFRPTKYVPLPSLISPNPLNFLSPKPCPGHLFENIHPKRCGNKPFYRMGTWPDGDPTNEDVPAAVESQQKLQLVDAHADQVFVILSHDENCAALTTILMIHFIVLPPEISKYVPGIEERTLAILDGPRSKPRHTLEFWRIVRERSNNCVCSGSTSTSATTRGTQFSGDSKPSSSILTKVLFDVRNDDDAYTAISASACDDPHRRAKREQWKSI